MKSPAFQFYPDAYLSSQRVQMMSLEEEGAYIRLLSYCWRHGSVPADPEQAAKLIGKGATGVLAASVLCMFLPGESGRMIHDRLEHERLKQAEWREKSAAGGRKSAALRNHRSTTVQPPLENGSNQNPTLPSPSPSPSPSPASGSVTVGRAGKAALPDTDWFLSLAKDPAYQGIAVAVEIAKCVRWCETNRKQASRRRVVNWLNRAERPLAGPSVRLGDNLTAGRLPPARPAMR